MNIRHKSKILLPVILTISLVQIMPPSSVAADKTIFKDPAQRAKLIGKHMLSLQWLQFMNNMYGNATVTDKDGVLLLKGEQRAKGKEKGYVTVDGRITEVSSHAFKFNGKIASSVSHINDGKECVRSGDLNFVAKSGRKYWRLQEMQSPCSEVTDYVDLYFK